MLKNALKKNGRYLVVIFLVFVAGCCCFWCAAKPIHRAAYKGNLKKVKKIIEKHPDQINAQDIVGKTPLYYASYHGYIDIVDFLLAHDANTEIGDDIDERPLFKAASFNHYEIAKALLDHGAKVNCKDIHDQTPLHKAAMQGDVNIINLLISYGADVSAKNDLNDTPLHLVAMCNRIEAVKALVEHGADIFEKNNLDISQVDKYRVFIRNFKNKTPKEIALTAGFKEIAEYLQTNEDEKMAGAK